MSNPSQASDHKFIEEKVAEYAAKLQLAQKEIEKEVWGQERIIRNTLTCMVADGHMLAVGAPGLAKTHLVSRVSSVLGLTSKRTQFTPETLPSDILGAEILETDENGQKNFKFLKGAVFTQFYMADEINRASPRTQAALLEIMQEKKATIAGEPYPLPYPFNTMATQNPLEQEGTYPLPEAQLDRFLMKLDFDYPDRDSEKRVMVETTKTKENIKELFERSASGIDLTDPTQYTDIDKRSELVSVFDKNDMVLVQKLAATLPLSAEVVDAAVEIVRRARPYTADGLDEINDDITWGPGPRALQAFAKASRARALMDGRLAPDVNDILELVDPVMEHRMALSPRARSRDVDFKHIKKLITRGI